MKRLCIAVAGITISTATSALAQVEISEVTGRLFRQFEHHEVSIGVGASEQIGVRCDGGSILSAGGFSKEIRPDGGYGYERLDLSNVLITSEYIASIEAVNRGDREFHGTVFAYALCWKL